MNIISCECGVVLDVDKLPISDELEQLEDGTINVEKAVWRNREYTPAALCPVCGELVTKGVE